MNKFNCRDTTTRSSSLDPRLTAAGSACDPSFFPLSARVRAQFFFFALWRVV